MIFDRKGVPLVIYERKAIGFIDRTLPLESSEPPSIAQAQIMPQREGIWTERHSGANQDPYARRTK